MIKIKKITFEEFKEDAPKTIKRLDSLIEEVKHLNERARKLKEKELNWKKDVEEQAKKVSK